MNNTRDPKTRILEAALKEFAVDGFGGARMDNIAKAAEINKAMLFYYFSSKKNLYQTVITDVLKQYIEHVKDLITPTLSPEKMLNQFPQIIISFFSKRQNFIRLIGMELLNKPENVVTIISTFIRGNIIDGPKIIANLVKLWNKTGLISEEDPAHFMMNIMALCFGSFITRPMVAGILGVDIGDDQEFFDKRIESIINVLKNGMLK